jgi:hypothetical protein
MSVGRIEVPFVDGVERLAELLLSLAQAGFTFEVRCHDQMDVWVVSLKY